MVNLTLVDPSSDGRRVRFTRTDGPEAQIRIVPSHHHSLTTHALTQAQTATCHPQQPSRFTYAAAHYRGLLCPRVERTSSLGGRGRGYDGDCASDWGAYE